MLNDSPLLDPNLLQSVSLRGVDVNRIAFFNHGQIACCGYEGRVGVMTGFNDRIFHAGVHEGKVTGVTVVSGEVFSVGEAGDLRLTSFHRNTSSLMAECDSPVLSMAPFGEDGVVTGHTDGTVRIWRPRADNVTLLRGHKGAVLAVTADRKGRVFSGGEDGELREWDIGSNMVNVFRGHGAAIRAIDVHVDGRVVTGADGAAAQEGSGGQPVVRIVSPRDGACEVFGAGARGDLRSLNVYYDGRVLAALSLGEGETSKGSLVVLDPRPGFVCYSLLRGHEAETRDCVSMGPRIVTCGSDAAGRNELRIWGTATYVEVERNKLKLMPDSMVKPPYYRSLF